MPFVVFIASPPIDDLRVIHKRATSEGTITKKQTVSMRPGHFITGDRLEYLLVKGNPGSVE